MSPANVLDVFDSFFRLRPDKDPLTVPGRILYEFGDAVRAFAAGSTVTAAPPSAAHRRVYLGGWPSASFWAVHGDLILSSLLYSGQVLIKDPIADWFSEEQYHNEHLIAARPGYRLQDGAPNVAGTRWFLSNVVPALQALRPLVDAGLVVLVPSEQYFARERDPISGLERYLIEQILGRLPEYTRRFNPSDIPVEDNVRGMFAFAGGERDQQLARAVGHGLRYFSREYALAVGHGATYVAPFSHERYLAQQGVSQVAAPSMRVAHAILKSELPIFRGLTPAVLAKMHQDDSFAAFREDLHKVYQQAPVEQGEEQLAAYIADQEDAMLRPRIQAAERSVAAGPLEKLGAVVSGSAFSLAAGLTVDALAGTKGIATGASLLKTLGEKWLERHKSQDSSSPLWSALVRHSRGVQDELRSVQAVEAAAGTASENAWGIPERPSMSVTVSRGALLADWMPGTPTALSSQHEGYSEGDYRPCDCGGPRKYRFCCKGI